MALAIAGLALVVVLLVLSQVLLPSIAESRLRSSLERNGDGVTVDVRATPAIKLLFGHADSVTVHVRRGSSGTGRLGDLLARTSATGRLDAKVDEMTTHGLPLHDVTLTKRGNSLVGQATVVSSELEDFLPSGIALNPAAGDGDGIVLKGELHAFGVDASREFRVAERDGALVVEPTTGFVGRFVNLPLFKDPRVRIDSVEERSRSGDYVVRATAHLAG